MNLGTRSDPANRAANRARAAFDTPIRQEREREQSQFYAEMVSSYMAIYAEYADEVVEHADSYFKGRAGG